MKEFTNDEKIIAKNIDKNYKWMARDRDGSLYAYEEKPKKAKIAEMWYAGCCSTLITFSHMFPAIKWEDEEPTRISDIYNPPVLNDAEREYLKTVLKPFRGAVKYVKKTKNGDAEYLFIPLYSNGVFAFPDFDPGTMYSGMESGKAYSLDELGITYRGKEQ
jgi:hypothetical protein